jgi:hypothetical protein
MAVGLRPGLVLAVWVLAAPALGSTTRATLALEYDDNPYESGVSRRAGLVSRLYVSTGSRVLDQPRIAIDVHHRCGFKRFWRRDPLAREAGDVVANHLEVGGVWQPVARLMLDWGTDIKLKNVQRVSSEESYLRGGLRASLVGRINESLSATLDLQQSADDARDSVLVDLRQRELGTRLHWQRGRELSVQAGLRWHWLRQDRPILILDSELGLIESARRQRDKLRELSLECQVYARLLAQIGYSTVDNHSNSLGYAYRSHQLRVTLARYLKYGVDGHLHVAAQTRTYTDDLSAVAGDSANGMDEYDQTVVSLRLRRPLSERYGVSWQYQWARNGSMATDESYRKAVYSVAIDMEI